MEIKKEKFLNVEEADNLQDMINFSASIKESENLNPKNKEEDINMLYPVESLYSKVMSNENITNKELDKDIIGVLNDKFYLFILKNLYLPIVNLLDLLLKLKILWNYIEKLLRIKIKLYQNQHIPH